METIYLNEKNLNYWQQRSTKNVIALGFFDGLHKGHQEVIKTASEIARKENIALSVMSFFPHPKTVLSNGKATFDYIMPLSEKAKVLKKLGVDRFYIVEFNKSFASLSPEEYVSKYLLDFGTVHAVAGYDFSYGSRGLGNIDRMKSDADKKLNVTKVNKIEYQGKKISSTWIRELLKDGNIDDLSHILGRLYEVSGKWDGFSLRLLPYYKPPAPGCYTAIIELRENIISTNVFVEEQGRIYFPVEASTELIAGEKITLTWKKRVREGAIYAYS